MEEVSAEDFLERVPEEERRTAVSLRVGILSLPGMEERCSLDSSTETYRIDFVVRGRVTMSILAVTPLKAEVRLESQELDSLVEHGDVAHLEFEAWGSQGKRGALAVIGKEAKGESPISLAIRSQEDLRSVTRLAHARYDMIITS